MSKKSTGLHAVQFGNNWLRKIPLTAKLDSAVGCPIWQSEEFFEFNYFQIGQHDVLLRVNYIVYEDKTWIV